MVRLRGDRKGPLATWACRLCCWSTLRLDLGLLYAGDLKGHAGKLTLKLKGKLHAGLLCERA